MRLLTLGLKPGLDWPLCHRTTEQWPTIVLRYDGTMGNPSLLKTKFPIVSFQSSTFIEGFSEVPDVWPMLCVPNFATDLFKMVNVFNLEDLSTTELKNFFKQVVIAIDAFELARLSGCIQQISHTIIQYLHSVHLVFTEIIKSGKILAYKR